MLQNVRKLFLDFKWVCYKSKQTHTILVGWLVDTLDCLVDELMMVQQAKTHSFGKLSWRRRSGLLTLINRKSNLISLISGMAILTRKIFSKNMLKGITPSSESGEILSLPLPRGVPKIRQGWNNPSTSNRMKGMVAQHFPISWTLLYL